jgi:hypothetical protein
MTSLTAAVGENAANLKPDVTTVQRLLNRVPAASGGPSPPLAVDGICGPKTLKAIRRFQKDGCGFQWPDGRISPNKRTWNALVKYDEPVSPSRPGQRKCGLLPGARLSFVDRQAAPAQLAKSAGFMPTGSQKSLAPIITGPSPGVLARYAPRPPSKSQLAVGKRIFGWSLDYGAILVVMAAPPGGALGVCLLGPGAGQNTIILSNPSDGLLIHELTHVWQSQHFPQNPAQYMANSLASQAKAALLGEDEYAYVPGKWFGAYAAEQIAEQVEDGEAPIRAHVRLPPMRLLDPFNVASLTIPRCEDPKRPGVKR